MWGRGQTRFRQKPKFVIFFFWSLPLYFNSLVFYRNGFELEACLKMPKPPKMFIAREMKHRSAASDFKILDCSLFQILEIWYPILMCLYLISLISYRKVFVLQTVLWILPFKWIMFQPSGMFLAIKITQKVRCLFVSFFFGHP